MDYTQHQPLMVRNSISYKKVQNKPGYLNIDDLVKQQMLNKEIKNILTQENLCIDNDSNIQIQSEKKQLKRQSSTIHYDEHINFDDNLSSSSQNSQIQNSENQIQIKNKSSIQSQNQNFEQNISIKNFNLQQTECQQNQKDLNFQTPVKNFLITQTSKSKLKTQVHFKNESEISENQINNSNSLIQQNQSLQTKQEEQENQDFEDSQIFQSLKKSDLKKQLSQKNLKKSFSQNIILKDQSYIQNEYNKGTENLTNLRNSSNIKNTQISENKSLMFKNESQQICIQNDKQNQLDEINDCKILETNFGKILSEKKNNNFLLINQINSKYKNKLVEEFNKIVEKVEKKETEFNEKQTHWQFTQEDITENFINNSINNRKFDHSQIVDYNFDIPNGKNILQKYKKNKQTKKSYQKNSNDQIYTVIQKNIKKDQNEFQIQKPTENKNQEKFDDTNLQFQLIQNPFNLYSVNKTDFFNKFCNQQINKNELQPNIRQNSTSIQDNNTQKITLKTQQTEIVSHKTPPQRPKSAIKIRKNHFNIIPIQEENILSPKNMSIKNNQNINVNKNKNQLKNSQNQQNLTILQKFNQNKLIQNNKNSLKSKEIHPFEARTSIFYEIQSQNLQTFQNHQKKQNNRKFRKNTIN
ncbi:hypothetical protein PPERSA_10566 [Pseudocohnilembus persalinus]|uniref:Uncharacterized protein n=1 Tax=Pseudocohnilembus persalinus TaxID=266149 RepID=A0A0V0Q9D2_PSEPJ|nr:hypothetical protein PPERSA_10566 [Pseudocohnilembus persalinus]|eukprot:KRW98795.1 hypothetical protein PPERSA_10566 [Pseudocohnilembus persalinus]